MDPTCARALMGEEFRAGERPKPLFPISTPLHVKAFPHQPPMAYHTALWELTLDY